MKFRSQIGLAGVLTPLLAAVSLTIGLSPLAQKAEAAAMPQEPGGRFKVLVVPLESKVLDDDFGEDVAERLSDRIDDMATHTPVPEKEFERALKKYEVKKEDLNAIRARQLANLMGAQVVFYGQVVRAGSAFEVRSSFIDVQTGDAVEVPAVTVRDDKDESQKAVADAVMEAFERQIKFVRARQFCADYVGSQPTDNALPNCNEALAINPSSVHALFNKGLLYRQLFENETEETQTWADSSMHYFERVLEEQPGHREALQNLAYVETQLGMAEQASRHYEMFLELEPENVPVRLKVAYDLAQGSLMKEAIEIIQEGLEYAPEDLDLLQALADYTLSYASTEGADSSYVDLAVQSYEKILELKGEETEQAVIENALAAYTKAGRTQEAAAFAEKALEAHPDSPRLWSLYADVLGRLERYSDASEAMDSALAIDGSYPNGYLKRGQFKLRNGNEAAAMADFEKAIQEGTSTRNDVFNLFWSEAHTARSNGRFSKAVEFFEHASKYASGEQAAEVEFWWAYSYYQLGEALANNQSASVNQLQRAQSAFQNAKSHFARAGNVRSEVPALKDATDKWLLNVEARIKQAQRN